MQEVEYRGLLIDMSDLYNANQIIQNVASDGWKVFAMERVTIYGTDSLYFLFVRPIVVKQQ